MAPRASWWALALAGVLLLGLPAQAAPVRITLESRVSVPRALVRLGDVATLRGTPARRELLARLPLGPVPSPGVVRRYTQDDLRKRLLAAGLDRGAFVFAGAEAALVRGTYLTVRAVQLVALARSEARRQGFSVGQPTLPPRAVPLHLEGGDLALAARVVRRRPRQVVVEVVITQGGKVSARRTVVLAVSKATKATPRRGAKTARSGRRSRVTSITPRRQSVIEAGDPVRVLVRDSGIVLTISGISRRAGAVGDLVRVRIPSTQRTLTARVLGPGRVLLDLGGE